MQVIGGGLAVIRYTRIDKMNFPYIKEQYVSGTSWYRIWSDGWIEQGGRVAQQAYGVRNVNFLKAFKNTNYSLIVTFTNGSTAPKSAGDGNTDTVGNCTTTGFSTMTDNNFGTNWRACGF